MKIRNGFVSNSSASSFILVAIQVDDIKDIIEKYNTDKNLEDKFNSGPYYVFSDHLNLQHETVDDKEYIGATMLHIDYEDCCIGQMVLPIKDIHEKTEIKELLKITGKTKDDLIIVTGDGEG